MRRKSERTVKTSPTKKTESTPRRTSRRTRKTPEKSINDDDSENNSSEHGSSSENETDEIVAPKRSRRSSRTIEKTPSAEDLRPTRTRRKTVAKKDVDTIEEDPKEIDQCSATTTDSKEPEQDDGEKIAVESSVENAESTSVDSSTGPTATTENNEPMEITQSNDDSGSPEEKTQDSNDAAASTSAEVKIKEKVEKKAEKNEEEEEVEEGEVRPDETEKQEQEKEEKKEEAPKPSRRRALKRTEKEPSPTEKPETKIESENIENSNESNNHETPSEEKVKAAADDNQESKNKIDDAKTEEKTESPQQSETVDEPKENGETNVTKKPAIVRKRKWLSNKFSAPKVQEIAISTDSLKGLISDVKPVPLSDVKLDSSPDVDHESDDVKVVSSTSLDYNRHSEERVSDTADDGINITTTRKISVVSEPEEQQPLSPAKHNPCNILFITNLVRPFTVLQLKSLLQRTGKIVENGFWMDKIKSKCFVKYETEDEAVETRHALHGIRWPSSNPKCLNVDFGTESLMQKAIESTAGDTKLFASRDERVVSSNELHESNREKAIERPVREWDLGKKSDQRRSRERDRPEKEHEPNKTSRSSREKERERDRDRNRDRDRDREHERERRRRSLSASPSRKYVKKENEPPLRLLDDLFRKTKTTPCIYWLPLTPEQIAVREEERQKALQRRLAMKKEREREEIEERERRRQREKRRQESRERERERRPASRERVDRERERDRDRRDRPNERRRY